MPSLQCACRSHPTRLSTPLKTLLSNSGVKKGVVRRRRAASSSFPLAIDPQLGPDVKLDGFEEFVLVLQRDLIEKAELLNGDEAHFRVDRWSRGTGSFGATCVLEDGGLLEKAAVNVTIGNGELTPERAAAMSSRGRLLDPKGLQQNCLSIWNDAINITTRNMCRFDGLIRLIVTGVIVYPRSLGMSNGELGFVFAGSILKSKVKRTVGKHVDHQPRAHVGME